MEYFDEVSITFIIELSSLHHLMRYSFLPKGKDFDTSQYPSHLTVSRSSLVYRITNYQVYPFLLKSPLSFCMNHSC